MKPRMKVGDKKQKMNNIFRSFSIICTVTCLSAFAVLVGCGGSGSLGTIIGVERKTPDEFAVVRRAPLTLPPDFSLRPPDPRGQRQQDLQTRDSAQDAVFGTNQASSIPNQSQDSLAQDSLAQNQPSGNVRSQANQPTSRGEQRLLELAGSEGDNSSAIRALIEQESASLAVLDEGLLENLIFWRQNTQGPESALIDPQEESRRVQESQVLGREISADPAPIIRRDGGAFFDWF